MKTTLRFSGLRLLKLHHQRRQERRSQWLLSACLDANAYYEILIDSIVSYTKPTPSPAASSSPRAALPPLADRNHDFHVGNGQPRKAFGQGRPVWLGQYVEAGCDLWGRYPVVIRDFSTAGMFTTRIGKHTVDGYPIQSATESALAIMMDNKNLKYSEYQLSPGAHEAGVSSQEEMILYVEAILSSMKSYGGGSSWVRCLFRASYKLIIISGDSCIKNSKQAEAK